MEHVVLNPNKLTPLHKMDLAITSYNIEMTEVTGGTFWRAFTPEQVAGKEPIFSAGLNDREHMMQLFPPINLKEPRIRTLGKALGPVWVRVSGTWATSTYYDFDGHTNGIAPQGYQSVMTKEQWDGVLDYVREIGGKLLVSVANCEGTHNEDGTWNPEQARMLFSYSREYGVPISAAEFMNEPNLLSMSGAPKGYGLNDFCRDQDAFFTLLKEEFPETLLVGPAATCDKDESQGEKAAVLDTLPIIATKDILAKCKIKPEIFSYHYYNGVSERGASMGGHWDAGEATTEEYLKGAANTCGIYLPLRDEFCPRAPIWVTESGAAACGGNSWDSTYLDVIRTANELGVFSTLTEGIIFHNTFASSDYGLLDPITHLPRPNYWIFLLWSRLMGQTVYDTHEPLREGVHLFAHSRRDQKNGVAYLLVNNSTSEKTYVQLSGNAEIYLLDAPFMRSTDIYLNGEKLEMADDLTMPKLTARQHTGSQLEIAPGAITFILTETDIRL